jgi:hypothetical protein
MRVTTYKAKGLFALAIGYHKINHVVDAIKRRKETLHSIELLLGMFVLAIYWETGASI